MKQFYFRIGLFLLLNVLLFLLILGFIRTAFYAKHWQTDPDVFVIPQNQTYQFVLLGTSHAEWFSRFSNQEKVASILHKRFFNLAQPDAGPLMEYIYLQFFLERNNKAAKAIYIIDPFVFYTTQANEEYLLNPYGEIDPKFFFLLVKNGITYPTLLDYIKTYMSFKWFIKSPRVFGPDQHVFIYNFQDINLEVKRQYSQGQDPRKRDEYIKSLNNIISLCREHNIHLTFVIPTTLIANDPGMQDLTNLLKQYSDQQHIPYYDFSHAITDPSLYSDTDHLNTKGILLFTEKFLSQAL